MEEWIPHHRMNSVPFGKLGRASLGLRGEVKAMGCWALAGLGEGIIS